MKHYAAAECLTGKDTRGKHPDRNGELRPAGNGVFTFKARRSIQLQRPAARGIAGGMGRGPPLLGHSDFMGYGWAHKKKGLVCRLGLPALRAAPLG